MQTNTEQTPLLAAARSPPRPNQNRTTSENVAGDHLPPLPETTANIASRWTMSWMDPLFFKGFRRQVQVEDLYAVPERNSASALGQRLKIQWDQELARVGKLNSENKVGASVPRQPSLIRATVKTFFREYFPAFVAVEIGDSLSVIAPLILAKLLLFIRDSQSDSPPDASTGYGLATALFAVSIVATLNYQRWNAICTSTGVHLRTAFIDLVFLKAQRLSPKARLTFPDGAIVNLMSVDVGRLEMSALMFLFMIAVPIFVTIILFFLIRFLGASALVGVSILALANPAQGWAMNKLGPVRAQASAITDTRIKAMQEAIQSILVIKLFAWESGFTKKVNAIRKRELAKIRQILVTRGLLFAVSSALPVFASASSIVLYAALGNELRPDVVFPSLAYYALLRVPLIVFLSAYTACVDAYVSFERLREFLLAEEAGELPPIDGSLSAAIVVDSASFMWDQLSIDSISEADALARYKKPYLQNINLSIPRGSLVGIVGSVGSGKSSLLQALVGTMTLTTGRVVRGAGISYAAQTPWIQNASARDNILFGKPFDAVKYKRVIDCCCLEADFAVLPAGDLTEIGERGVNLSGGQKARLSLARSAYYMNEPGILIWDDPLSAVDSHVGRRLWKECVLGELKHHTRIIATHQLHLLPDVDYVIYMKDGHISDEGPFDVMMTKGKEFAELMHRHGGIPAHGDGGHHAREGDSTRALLQHDKSAGKQPSSEARQDLDRAQKAVDQELDEHDDSNSSTSTMRSADATPPAIARQIVDEERESGAINSHVYVEYFRTCGVRRWALVSLFFLLQMSASVGANIWLSWWTAGRYNLTSTQYILIYVGWALTQLTLIGVAFFLLTRVIVETADSIHARAFAAVLHSPLFWFDTNPIGRILNRFSKDMDAVDNALWINFNDIFVTVSGAFGTLSLVCFYFPWMLVAIVPMAWIYSQIANYFRTTSRELKRLDSVLRSKLYAYFSESLTGRDTLRAFGAIPQAIKENRLKLDAENEVYYLFALSPRWLAARVQLVGISLVYLTSLSIVVGRFWLNEAAVGLVMSYLMRIGGDISWIVQCIANLENNMNAAERLMHYVDNLPRDAPVESPQGREPTPMWPSRGALCFRSVSMRYRKGLSRVLNNVSFEIEAGQKIGVVGRTGAGKSSLIQALFRLVELDEGQIVLDGVDIRSVGSRTLRSKIAIIPQEPVMFAGTIRYNLDPLSKYDDDELWKVLETSDLKAFVQAQDAGLDAMIATLGENLSVGQRQLVCLSRALLARAKVVVLDEATASVDMATDGLIQRTIRTDFAGSTTITIAHRLATIVDYDKVLVMDQGRVVEFDTPARLLQDPSSSFSRLVEETGARNAAKLRMMVK